VLGPQDEEPLERIDHLMIECTLCEGDGKYDPAEDDQRVVREQMRYETRTFFDGKPERSRVLAASALDRFV